MLQSFNIIKVPVFPPFNKNLSLRKLLHHLIFLIMFAMLSCFLCPCCKRNKLCVSWKLRCHFKKQNTVNTLLGCLNFPLILRYLAAEIVNKYYMVLTLEDRLVGLWFENGFYRIKTVAKRCLKICVSTQSRFTINLRKDNEIINRIIIAAKRSNFN